MGTEASQENSYCICEVTDMALGPRTRRRRKWINEFSNFHHLGGNQKLLCESGQLRSLSSENIYFAFNFRESAEALMPIHRSYVRKLSLDDFWVYSAVHFVRKKINQWTNTYWVSTTCKTRCWILYGQCKKRYYTVLAFEELHSLQSKIG